MDQTAVYEEVYAYLNNHECVTIFPEGGSHDRSEMLPLKGMISKQRKNEYSMNMYSWICCYGFGCLSR